MDKLMWYSGHKRHSLITSSSSDAKIQSAGMSPPVLVAAISISDGVHRHNFAANFSSTAIKFKSRPIYRYKPPPLEFTATPIPRIQSFIASSSKGDCSESLNDSSIDRELQQLDESPSIDCDEIEVEIEKISKNRRRIRSKVSVDASLKTIWGILTDYERLADFIPSLVVSQVLDQRENFARLLQIGQQNLAFGLKFNAKGVVDCYEKDFESLPFGQGRDIEFKMIEGDFELFEGKWSIEQSNSLAGQQYNTILSYTVEVQPKMWLPVRLVEGRISKEIKMNLYCIRQVAEKT